MLEQVAINQRKASDPNYSIWVNASAGSGKTTILVKRFLRMLLSGIELGKILCITYTNTGATEMRERINKQLAEWVSITDEELEEELKAIGETRDKIGIARTLFAKVLDASDDLKILTIHSFCQQIIKRFPLEINVVPNFSIITPNEKDELLKECYEKIFKDVNFENDIKTLAKHINEEQFNKLLEKILEKQNDLIFLKENYEGSIFNVCKNVFQIENEIERSFTDEEIEKYLKADYEIRKKYDGNQDAVECFNYIEYIHNKENYELTKAFLRIVFAVYEEYDLLKRKEGVLDFEDLIFKTYKLLSGEYNAWVQYKLDYNIEHILLDESQDTSVLQWDIVKSITTEFFAGDDGNKTNRTIFVVGDEKQSIYGFQGAMPELFEENRRYYEQQTVFAKKNFENIKLNTSFRSVKEILNNVVDEVEFQNKTVHSIYRNDIVGRVEIMPLVCTKSQNNENSNEDEKKEEFLNWTNFESDIEEDNKQKLATAIVKEIKNWFKQGKVINNSMPGKNDIRLLKYSDIILLVKNRNSIIDYLIQQFNLQNIPVMGKDRFDFKEHIITKDIIALLKFLVFPDDDLNLANIFKSPFLDGSEKKLFELLDENREQTLWEKIQKDNNCSEIKDFLQDVVNKSKILTLSELLYYVFEIKQMRKRFRERFTNVANEIIDTFLQTAISYENNSNNATILNFIDSIEKNDSEIKRDLEHGVNAIRIMTVHASKGMEAPIVFLVDANHYTQTINKNDSIFEYKCGNVKIPLLEVHNTRIIKKMKEELKDKNRRAYERELYVAMTRAKNELYICGCPNNKKEGENNSWYGKIYDAMEKNGELVKNEIFEGDSIVVGNKTHTFNPSLGDVEQENKKCNEILIINRNKTKRIINNKKVINPSIYYNESTIKKPTENTESIKNGILIHKLLKILPDLPKEKWSIVLNEYSQNIRDLTVNILTKFKYLFEEDNETKILNEVPIYGAISDELIMGQIDKLIIKKDVVQIIDFKTSNRLLKIIPTKYKKQMEYYKKVIEKIYNDRKVECCILLVNFEKMIEI